VALEYTQTSNMYEKFILETVPSWSEQWWSDDEDCTVVWPTSEPKLLLQYSVSTVTHSQSLI